jgi:hypothetical protein
MDHSNHLHHVFGNSRHKLDRVVRQYGGRAAAGRAIQEAVDAAFAVGELSVNARGVSERTLDVGGNPATVRGVIHEGRPRVGSAWIF